MSRLRLWRRARRHGRRGGARFELAAARHERSSRHLPPLRRIVAATLALALTGGVIYGAGWLMLGDSLRVRDITVVGAQVADPHRVAAKAGVGGESLLTLDTGAVAERIAALPAVRRASVQREWPRGVRIKIAEHQGWGYWQAAGARAVIDADGQVRTHARPPAPGAPTIIELDATGADGIRPHRDAVRLVERLLTDGSVALLGVRPAGFTFSHERGLTVLIEGGLSVVFGDTNSYEFKVAGWGALLERIRREQLAVSEIDLRFGRHLVMR